MSRHAFLLTALVCALVACRDRSAQVLEPPTHERASALDAEVMRQALEALDDPLLGELVAEIGVRVSEVDAAARDLSNGAAGGGVDELRRVIARLIAELSATPGLPDTDPDADIHRAVIGLFLSHADDILARPRSPESGPIEENANRH